VRFLGGDWGGGGGGGLTGGQKSSWTSTTIRAGLKAVAMVWVGSWLVGCEERWRALGGGRLLVVVVAGGCGLFPFRGCEVGITCVAGTTSDHYTSTTSY